MNRVQSKPNLTRQATKTNKKTNKPKKATKKTSTIHHNALSKRTLSTSTSQSLSTNTSAMKYNTGISSDNNINSVNSVNNKSKNNIQFTQANCSFHTTKPTLARSTKSDDDTNSDTMQVQMQSLLELQAKQVELLVSVLQRQQAQEDQLSQVKSQLDKLIKSSKDQPSQTTPDASKSTPASVTTVPGFVAKQTHEKINEILESVQVSQQMVATETAHLIRTLYPVNSKSIRGAYGSYMKPRPGMNTQPIADGMISTTSAGIVWQKVGDSWKKIDPSTIPPGMKPIVPQSVANSGSNEGQNGNQEGNQQDFNTTQANSTATTTTTTKEKGSYDKTSEPSDSQEASHPQSTKAKAKKNEATTTASSPSPSTLSGDEAQNEFTPPTKNIKRAEFDPKKVPHVSFDIPEVDLHG